MMYPFMTLDDDTEIVHSDMLPDGRVKVYIERIPLEPVHVHVSQGSPAENTTKIWITRSGKCLLCNNKSQIPSKVLRNIMRIIESRSCEIIEKWVSYFGEIRYFC